MKTEFYDLLTTIAYKTAPTILLNKPSSLISFTKGNRDLYLLWDMYKEDIKNELSLEYYELRRTSQSVLVLFFKIDELSRHLSDPKRIAFLENYGYHANSSLEESLSLLRTNVDKGFYHEIGIFLGYPIKDVIGFIENKGKDYIFKRYWKVYHRPDRAKKLFDSYDKAKEQMINSITINYSYV
ncbi:DUF3793 family protein [Natranaerofaba carboxydovora]|uniref:DUF3793 family protein n=1 Tax=Natranaerofaba carboxydovora TaxID=2742683 RepID=UPI001F131504|nr:DUF3793 family protein [Natranaerofaba carboxydovora]UMZ74369.1 hypothetical protein ACONDI_01957 [Natranaerofaba carboxydovora]